MPVSKSANRECMYLQQKQTCRSITCIGTVLKRDCFRFFAHACPVDDGFTAIPPLRVTFHETDPHVTAILTP